MLYLLWLPWVCWYMIQHLEPNHCEFYCLMVSGSSVMRRSPAGATRHTVLIVKTIVAKRGPGIIQFLPHCHRPASPLSCLVAVTRCHCGCQYCQAIKLKYFYDLYLYLYTTLARLFCFNPVLVSTPFTVSWKPCKMLFCETNWLPSQWSNNIFYNFII